MAPVQAAIQALITVFLIAALLPMTVRLARIHLVSYRTYALGALIRIVWNAMELRIVGFVRRNTCLLKKKLQIILRLLLTSAQVT